MQQLAVDYFLQRFWNLLHRLVALRYTKALSVSDSATESVMKHRGRHVLSSWGAAVFRTRGNNLDPPPSGRQKQRRVLGFAPILMSETNCWVRRIVTSWPVPGWEVVVSLCQCRCRGRRPWGKAGEPQWRDEDSLKQRGSFHMMTEIGCNVITLIVWMVLGCFWGVGFLFYWYFSSVVTFVSDAMMCILCLFISNSQRRFFLILIEAFLGK